ncbi:MAG: hypothetical protein JXP34_28875 [Planctomycetes bacterium]|nr:hypothetical protein [Planctomycetota bacterium]
MRWSTAFPDAIGPPAIADVEGAGEPAIVVVCANGFVYGIGRYGVGPMEER